MKNITEEKVLGIGAELFQTGHEMYDQLNSELNSTYWTLESISDQRRSLNQISIDIEDIKLALESGDFDEIKHLFEDSTPIHPSAPIIEDLEYNEDIDTEGIPF